MKRGVPTAVVLALLLSSAHAMDAAPQKPAAPPPSWLDTLTIDGYLSGGVAIYFSNPYNKINFGHLETDRANRSQFNQAILAVSRPLDKKATDLDFGFRFLGMLGTDARYTQFLGQTEYLIRDRTQLSIIDAHLETHLPILTKGGVDINIGQFISYNGFEKLTSKDNIFYTRSYSSNFGPFVDTGIMSILHATDWLDLYVGIVTGVDTWIGWPGDNNNSPSIHGGFGLNLLNGDLSILAVTHSGPENPNVKDPLNVGWPDGVVGGVPAACACNPNTVWRTFNNVTVTWSATENLNFATDISYFRESGWYPISILGLSSDTLNALGDNFGFNPSLIPQRPRGANAYGVAQYATYKVNDSIKLGARVEFWRDAKNFFAAAYPGYFDSVNSEHGFPAPSMIVQPQGQGTSYLAITAGITFSPKLTGVPFFSGLIFRPEIRWEAAVNDAAPFFGPSGAKRSQGLFSMDVIAPFTIQ
jgi:hypothetical protein